MWIEPPQEVYQITLSIVVQIKIRKKSYKHYKKSQKRNAKKDNKSNKNISSLHKEILPVKNSFTKYLLNLIPKYKSHQIKTFTYLNSTKKYYKHSMHLIKMPDNS
jgi:hypothetical protein